MTVKSIALSLLGLACAVPLGLSLVLYTFQDRLIFHPRALHPELKELATKTPQMAAVQLHASDQALLKGWVVRRPAGSPLILYWGGNAEEITSFAVDAALAWPRWSVVAINYRGYGESSGVPSERALFEDALLVTGWALSHLNCNQDKVVLLGRSLGSAVAVHVAAHVKVAGVVLVTPFDSMTNVAQSRYPIVPVSRLLKHQFDSLSLAPRIDAKLLALLASDDSIVPAKHSQALLAAWKGAKRAITIANTDHNSISESDDYQQALGAFLQEIAP
ncbi:MAG: alpha/beta hydrolase [Magnetococcales bacterium]|nr:alpha/beta hydrolase [Magnetococcales bacterium]